MNLSTAREIVLASVKANQATASKGARSSQYIIPMLWGVAGLGKTTLVQDIAEDLDLSFVDLRLNQYDAGELGGFPILKDDTMLRARPHFLPTEGEGILFLDELPQAPVANQNIAAQLVNERRIGEHAIGEGWTIVCAGNDLSHRAGTNAMPTHLKDRLLHLEIEPNLDDALHYMNAHGVRPEVTGFLRFKPDQLSKFDKDAKACPSPRSWEKVSGILNWGLDEGTEMEAIMGQVGLGAASDFKAFLSVYRELPDPELPLKDPVNAPIPQDPSVMYAVCAGIAYRVNKTNSANFMAYLKRIPQQEFSAFAVKSALSRYEGLKKEPALRDWILSGGAELVL
tara:strand:- start:4130 stop:5149 length:1020 start_codon:yes stop_codon:yes gene_type:complete